MDQELKDRFIRLWHAYFPGAELPIAFHYVSEPGDVELAEPVEEHRCLIADLNEVRRGQSLCFDIRGIGCAGGRRYTGFSQMLMPNFEYFLSCGIPGRLEGERYKQTPEIVRELLEEWPTFVAPDPYIVFKRWDALQEADKPEVVIFYATPDVLAGLFTLANFDETDPNTVFAPMAAGCATIVQYPYLERDNDHPRAVLGMFDPSARPWVKPNVLTFAVPMTKFTRMIANMSDSFLTTHTWERIRHRMEPPATVDAN